MALTVATRTRQAPLPGAVVADGGPGGTFLLSPSDLAVPGARTQVGGTDGVTAEPGVCRFRYRRGAAAGAPRAQDRVQDLIAALVSLSSRSGSTPDLLDVAGRLRGGRHVLRTSGPRPATIVRVPSGSTTVALRPGGSDGPPRRTAIPLFAQSC